MIHRRTFIGALGGSLTAVPLLGKGHAKPKRLAMVATEWRLYSHAWHMGQRFLAGYPLEGRWHQSPIKFVSAYVDQTPENDLSRERESRFEHLTIYPTATAHGSSGFPSIPQSPRRFVAEGTNWRSTWSS